MPVADPAAQGEVCDHTPFRAARRQPTTLCQATGTNRESAGPRDGSHVRLERRGTPRLSGVPRRGRPLPGSRSTGDHPFRRLPGPRRHGLRSRGQVAQQSREGTVAAWPASRLTGTAAENPKARGRTAPTSAGSLPGGGRPAPPGPPSPGPPPAAGSAGRRTPAAALRQKRASACPGGPASQRVPRPVDWGWDPQTRALKATMRKPAPRVNVPDPGQGRPLAPRAAGRDQEGSRPSACARLP